MVVMVTFYSSKEISPWHSVVHITIPRIDIASPTTVFLVIFSSCTTLETKSSVFIMIVVFRVYTLLNKNNEIKLPHETILQKEFEELQLTHETVHLI